MSANCVKCGSPLAEGQLFCTSCGTRQADSSANSIRPCTACKAPLKSGAKFCEACGAQAVVEESTNSSAAAPDVEVVRGVFSAKPASATPANSGSKLIKVVLIAAALLVFVIILAMGSCAYVAYRAKQRFDGVQQAYKKDDLAGMIAAATGQARKPVSLPDWKPASADLLSSPTSKIPLRKSLTTVDVGNDPLRGDFESIFTVDAVNDESVHIRAAQQFPSGDNLDRLLNHKSATDTKPRTIRCGRTVLRSDMENATQADSYFCREGSDEKRPGRTAMTISRKTFNELKTTGQTEIVFHEDPLRAVLKSFKNAMASNSSDDSAGMDLAKKMMSFAPGSAPMETPGVKYIIHRQDRDLAFPVLLNQRPVELPVMDVIGKRPDGIEAHVYILDDPDNPMFLAAASAELGREQVAKIYWDQAETGNDLAAQLEKNGRAKVYNLYFDFASSTLRPESDKVLKEIAQVMRQHPEWKLSVEGHTDNIGGIASNLELSKHRAAAVVSSLAVFYGIDAKRFSSTGFGASRPVDTNDTLEGRARNRRVELVRE